MLPVSKPFLPPFDEYAEYLQQIWNDTQLSNQGPLLTKLEAQLQEYLGVKHLQIVSSGTVALQIAIHALELKGEIITTSFSFVATLNTILWGNCKPVFVDIDRNTLCIDPNKIEAAITENTCAILATHVYGYPCSIDSIEEIANKYGLKVIYDGAHAFGVRVKNQSIFNYGDVSTVSFHATKLYHTVEGGAIITQNDQIARKCMLIRNFGLEDGVPFLSGINGKNSELHAAMGLCNLSKVTAIMNYRKEIFYLYKSLLQNLPLHLPDYSSDIIYNYAYFPILFTYEEEIKFIMNILSSNGIESRRYFYPTLNKVPYFDGEHCPIAEEVSRKILCLPLHTEMLLTDAQFIANLIVSYYDTQVPIQWS